MDGFGGHDQFDFNQLDYDYAELGFSGLGEWAPADDLPSADDHDIFTELTDSPNGPAESTFPRDFADNNLSEHAPPYDGLFVQAEAPSIHVQSLQHPVTPASLQAELASGSRPIRQSNPQPSVQSSSSNAVHIDRLPGPESQATTHTTGTEASSFLREGSTVGSSEDGRESPPTTVTNASLKTGSPYSCEVDGCDKSFKTPAGLKKHRRYHIPYHERPCVCDMCPHRALFPKDLKRHKFKHWTASFRCQCGKVYKRKDHLERHQRKHATRSRPEHRHVTSSNIPLGFLSQIDRGEIAGQDRGPPALRQVQPTVTFEEPGLAGPSKTMEEQYGRAPPYMSAPRVYTTQNTSGPTNTIDGPLDPLLQQYDAVSAQAPGMGMPLAMAITPAYNQAHHAMPHNPILYPWPPGNPPYYPTQE